MTGTGSNSAIPESPLLKVHRLCIDIWTEKRGTETYCNMQSEYIRILGTQTLGQHASMTSMCTSVFFEAVTMLVPSEIGVDQNLSAW